MKSRQWTLIFSAALSCCTVSGTQAAIVSNTLHDISILGHRYDVAFKQDTVSGTSFDEVFGTGTPSFYFSDAASAAVAGKVILDAVEAANFDPTPIVPAPVFMLAYDTRGSGFDGYSIWRTTPIYRFAGLYGPFFNSNRTDGFDLAFAVLTQTDVPEPNGLALAMLALMGVVLTRRKRPSRNVAPPASRSSRSC